jgi:hypothetical protein
MNKKELILGLIGFSLILLISISTTTSAVSPYVGVEVGDSYDYKVPKINIFAKHNDIIYAEGLPFDFVGKTITIEITAIYDYTETGIFFPFEEGTGINVTESYDSTSYNSVTLLDEWFATFASIQFLYYFSVLQFNPEFFEFIPPDPLEETEEDYPAQPAFASTNKSFYMELEEDATANLIPVSFAPNEQDILIETNPEETFNVTYFEDSNEFFMNVSLHHWGSGTTTTAQNWDINGYADFETYINVNEGLVEYLYYKFGYIVNIGTNNTKMEVEYELDRITADGRPAFTIDYSFITPLLTVFGILAAITIWRKKRIQ